MDAGARGRIDVHEAQLQDNAPRVILHTSPYPWDVSISTGIDKASASDCHKSLWRCVHWFDPAGSHVPSAVRSLSVYGRHSPK